MYFSRVAAIRFLVNDKHIILLLLTENLHNGLFSIVYPSTHCDIIAEFIGIYQQLLDPTDVEDKTRMHVTRVGLLKGIDRWMEGHSFNWTPSVGMGEERLGGVHQMTCGNIFRSD